MQKFTDFWKICKNCKNCKKKYQHFCSFFHRILRNLLARRLFYCRFWKMLILCKMLAEVFKPNPSESDIFKEQIQIFNYWFTKNRKLEFRQEFVQYALFIPNNLLVLKRKTVMKNVWNRRSYMTYHNIVGDETLSHGCALDALSRVHEQLLRSAFHHRSGCAYLRHALDVLPGQDVRLRFCHRCRHGLDAPRRVHRR